MLSAPILSHVFKVHILLPVPLFAVIALPVLIQVQTGSLSATHAMLATGPWLEPARALLVIQARMLQI